MKTIKTILGYFTLEMAVKRVLCAYTLSSIIFLLLNRCKINDLNFINNKNMLPLLSVCIFIFSAVTVIYMLLSDRFKWLKRIDDWLLVPFLTIYLTICCVQVKDPYFSFTASLIIIAAIFFCCKKGRVRLLKITDMGLGIVIGGAALFIVFYAGVLMGLRYMTFSTPCFDFGIFSQMFENMKDTFLPDTTCERNELLSHFAIHFSPAYYLMLPFYLLAPNPFTLQVLQGIFLASGIVPLVLLCKHKKLSNNVTVAILICYALFPALTGGCTYDLHENMMLTPFILWLFYFIEKDKMWGIILFSLLTLMVKEDAAVYVAVIGLYMMFSRRSWLKGGIVLALSLSYFLGACWFLEEFGRGIMSNRYSNFIKGDGGLIDVIYAVILDPGLLVYELLDEEKIIYVLQMLLPIGFLPFMTKRFSRYILFIPFILVNLMSDYGYQHSINFQYVFGVIAIFFYLTIINVSDMQTEKKRLPVSMAPLCALLIFASTVGGELTYVERFNVNYDENQEMFRVLETLPQDKLIGSTTYLVPALYKQKQLYEIAESHKPDVDIAIIDMRYNSNQVILDEYISRGYTLKVTGHKIGDEKIKILWRE